MTEPETDRRRIRIGATVAVALGLFAVGTFLIGREQRLWQRKVGYEIRFTRTNGLRAGAPVSLSGVDIGSVDQVLFPNDPDAIYIAVRVTVASGAAQRIRQDTIARIRTIGLLGDKYVELTAGLPDSPQLPPGSVIFSHDPIDYEELLGGSGDIVSNIVEASNSLKNVFASIDRGEGLLGRMLRDKEQGAGAFEDVRKTVAHLEATTASIERVAADVEAGKGTFGLLLKRSGEAERLLREMNRAAASLAETARRLAAAQGALPRLVEDEAYGRALLADLQTTVRNLAEVSDKLNHGDGTIGRLVNDPTLYRDAKALVDSTRSSWAFGLYRGIRGLLPPYGSPPESTPVPPPAAPVALGPSPSPAATPTAPPRSRSPARHGR
jgi:phospholipid/cholesterol/gamma-HCH transport system substrate-binding protein